MAINSLVEARRAAAERKIQAVDEYWSAMLCLRNNRPTALSMLDMLSPAEIRRVASRPNQRAIFGVDALQEGISQLLSCDPWSARPFVGDKCYSLLFGYRAVLGRTAYLLMDDLGKGGDIRIWHQEQHIRDLFEFVLIASELSELDGLRSGHLARFTDFVEARMLTYLREIISGQDTSDEDLEHARKILELVASWEPVSRSTTEAIGFAGLGDVAHED